MKRVSIIISCFNYARYVRLAIDSALAQDWPEVEVIVVDDGSTDDSPAVIGSYGTRIHALQQANQGHVAALNHGFSACTGDIVIFLDADDILMPGAARSAAENWVEGCAKVQYNLAVIDSEGSQVGWNCCNFPAGYSAATVRDEFRHCNTYMWPVSSGNAYGNAFLQQVMPLNTRRAPDGLLNTVAPLFGDVVTLDRVLGLYRIHESNQSYQGAGANGVEERFAKRIALRRVEERTLLDLAAQRGQALAPVSLLDHELVFINYRLMVRKMRIPYEGDAHDSVPGLWRRGIAFLLQRPLPATFRLQNAAWLSILAVSPAPLARQLVLLRFNRGNMLRPVRQARARLRSLLQRS